MEPSGKPGMGRAVTTKFPLIRFPDKLMYKSEPSRFGGKSLGDTAQLGFNQRRLRTMA
jgi:hypothetical protein